MASTSQRITFTQVQLHPKNIDPTLLPPRKKKSRGKLRGLAGGEPPEERDLDRMTGKVIVLRSRSEPEDESSAVRTSARKNKGKRKADAMDVDQNG